MPVEQGEGLKAILAGSNNLPLSASNKVQKPLPPGMGFDWKPSDRQTQKDIIQADYRDEVIRRAVKDTKKPVVESKPVVPRVGIGKGLMTLLEGVIPVAKATKAAFSLKGSKEWDQHSFIDQEKTKPHMQEWAGGYNRKSRNAGSFYGGYDAAIRWPDKIEELKTLAKGYQMVDAATSIGKKGASFREEMEDALANISGIEAAERDLASGKKIKLGEELDDYILDKAKQYSSTYTVEDK